MKKKSKTSPKSNPEKSIQNPDDYIAAGEFKAHCLKLMDEVQKRRKSLIITKHGKPVAKISPVETETKPRSLYGCMKSSGEITGDLIEPVDVCWEADE